MTPGMTLYIVEQIYDYSGFIDNLTRRRFITVASTPELAKQAARNAAVAVSDIQWESTPVGVDAEGWLGTGSSKILVSETQTWWLIFKWELDLLTAKIEDLG